MTSVGRYRLLRRLGRGGMAEVVEAVALGEAGFQRRVAVKRMLPEFREEPAFGRMFLDEARIASQLHHANIVGVLDYGVADGVPFQVHEYVEGLSLRQLLATADRARLEVPIEIALFVATEVAHALEYAHVACDLEGRPLGIVHRDVSPGNILVSWNGDVKLTDFGIAFARDRLETTHVGQTKGTRLYMAPEQMLQSEVDGRTDLFALGCVLHRLNAGDSPLEREQSMQRLLTGHELALDSLLAPDVWEIIRCATRASREDRYENATAMAAQLGAALALRMAQDGKSVLRDWLAKVRPVAVEVAPQGHLDDLINVELVLHETANDTRQFLSAASTDWAATAPEAPGARARADELGALERPTRGRWIGLGLALAVGATIAAAWVFWARPRSQASQPQPGPQAQPVAGDQPGPRSTVAPPPAPSPRQPATEPAGQPKRVRHSLRATRPSDLSAGEAPGAAVGTGFVIVGGESVLRAEILVDGKSSGFAPKKLELPVGRHVLTLVMPNGSRLGPRVVTVTARHTASAPLSWIVSSSL